MQNPPPLLFEVPSQLPGMSDIAFSALRLAALSSRLALEDRTLVNHPTGRAENVAEHSHMLAIVAPAIAEMYYPDLDANLISRFAAIHDAVEAYVGDTTTHNIDEKGLSQKAEREAYGMQRLKEDFAWLPTFTSLIDQYEEQKMREARFVRIVDKWTPALVHFADQGATVRSYTDPQRLVDDYQFHATRLKKHYPDFIELVAVREELTQLIGEHLF